jgi:hypothetical protein
LVWGVVRGLFGTTEGYFLVESAESLHFHLCLGETCLHLHVRLFEVHDMVGSSFQKRNLATLLVGDGQDIFESGISVTEFVSATLFRLDALPSSGLLPGVGKMFSEGDTHHWIFFVRDRAAAAATTRGAGRGGGRVVSYGASVGKAVTAAGGGGSCGRVGTSGVRTVWTCIGTRNIGGDGIIDMGRRGRWGRCRKLEVTMRRRAVIHGASEVALRRHHLKRSLILQHVRFRHGRGARTIYNLIRRLQRGRLVGWIHEAVAVIIA